MSEPIINRMVTITGHEPTLVVSRAGNRLRIILGAKLPLVSLTNQSGWFRPGWLLELRDPFNLALLEALEGKPVKIRQPNRIKRVEQHSEFNALHSQQLAAGDTNDCTVKAAAVVTGLPYTVMREQFAAAGRKNGRGFNLQQTLDLIRKSGKSLRLVALPDMIARYPGHHARALKGVTTHHIDRFPKAWSDGKTYFLDCCKHVAAVQNGRLLDWSRDRALRVRRIWEVV